MGCDNRCNSSLACGITNTIIRNLIAENCGEGGIEEPDTSGCEATGAINSGVRANAYLAVQNVMEELLGRPVVATYKEIKAATMTLTN